MKPSPLTWMYICAYTKRVEYELDPAKADANFRKHGVFFSDAVGVLEDELALTFRDPYSEEEERWITLGMDLLGGFSLSFLRGEAKQFDSFRRDLQRRANGGITKVSRVDSIQRNEVKP